MITKARPIFWTALLFTLLLAVTHYTVRWATESIITQSHYTQTQRIINTQQITIAELQAELDQTSGALRRCLALNSPPDR